MLLECGRLAQASWFGGNKYPKEPTSGGNRYTSKGAIWRKRGEIVTILGVFFDSPAIFLILKGAT